MAVQPAGPPPATGLSRKALEHEREYLIARLVEINEELQRRICMRVIHKHTMTENKRDFARMMTRMERGSGW